MRVSAPGFLSAVRELNDKNTQERSKRRKINTSRVTQRAVHTLLRTDKTSLYLSVRLFLSLSLSLTLSLTIYPFFPSSSFDGPLRPSARVFLYIYVGSLLLLIWRPLSRNNNNNNNNTKLLLLDVIDCCGHGCPEAMWSHVWWQRAASTATAMSGVVFHGLSALTRNTRPVTWKP
jgi:hypothetical protein